MKPDHVTVTRTVAGAVNLIGIFPSDIDGEFSSFVAGEENLRN